MRESKLISNVGERIRDVREGPDGDVFLPVLYPGAAAETDDLLRLGRKTEWRGGEGQPVRGVGQRTFWIGGEDRPYAETRATTHTEKITISGDKMTMVDHADGTVVTFTRVREGELPRS